MNLPNPRPTNVLFLNYEFPPLGGGAAQATHSLFTEFAQFPNLSITLITSSIDKMREEQFAPNIRVIFLDIGKNGNLHYQSQKDLLVYSWKAYRTARKLLKKESYDLVHAFFGIPCGYIAMKLGLPYLVSLRGSDVPFYNPRFRLLDALVFQRLSKKVWKKARAVIANSDELTQLAHETLPELAIPVIPNGVNTTIFSPAQDTPRSTDLVHILCVSRLIERKGIHYLIDAFAQIQKTTPHIELTIAGDGNMRQQLEGQVREYGMQEHVHFLGNVAHEKLPDLYRQADLFVLPSQNEGMSNTALEALASGLPLILTDTGGAHRLADGNGIVIPVNDQPALMNALETLIGDAEKRCEYALKSREKALTYSWKATAEAYIEYYQRFSV